MSGSRVSKGDLIRLARALGDEAADELDGETVGCIFERCMQRAEQLGAPASVYPLDGDEAHPIVRDWARRVVDGAVDHVLSCRMGDNEAERFAAGWVDSAVRHHAAIDPATCSHTMRLGRCIRCGQKPPAAPEYDGPALEPRDEDGAPMDMRADPDREADELSHLRPAAHVERVRRLLEEEPGRADRRQNAEQWAKTRGSKGAAHTG